MAPEEVRPSVTPPAVGRLHWVLIPGLMCESIAYGSVALDLESVRKLWNNKQQASSCDILPQDILANGQGNKRQATSRDNL